MQGKLDVEQPAGLHHDGGTAMLNDQGTESEQDRATDDDTPPVAGGRTDPVGDDQELLIDAVTAVDEADPDDVVDPDPIQ